jgi:hypothetical protein
MDRSGEFDLAENGPLQSRRPGDPAPSLDALALVLVVLAGVLCLAMPFWGDQALFTLYGRALTRGAVLYRDVFDIKQPGIFVFYAVGGLLFGFTEVGIHLFELAYWLAFSVFAIGVLRPYFTTRWGAPLVPVFTAVVYYLYAEPLDLTQIEILVAFPLLVAWWLVDRAEPATHKGLWRYAGAGLAAAAVILIKYPYVLIVLAFLTYTLLRSRRRGVRNKDLRRSLAAFFIALLVPLVIVVAYFAAYGQLGRIWWAYFELGAAQLRGSKPFGYLAVWGRRFLIGHGPIMIMATLGSVHSLRERARPKLDLVAGMLLWGTVGAIAFLTQSWYEYKLLLFTFPLGIVAVVGLEALLSIVASVGRERRLLALTTVGGLAVLSFVVSSRPHIQTLLLVSVAVGCCMAVITGFFALSPRVLRRVVQVLLVALAVSAGLTAIGPADKVSMLRRHHFAMTGESREDLQRSWNPLYGAVDQDLEVLRSRLQPGALQVFGDPLLQLQANRRQATPFVSLRPELYDERAWREVYSDLRSTLPPNIVIDPLLRSSIQRRYPAIMELIQSRYKVVLVGSTGTWYVRRDLMASVALGMTHGPEPIASEQDACHACCTAALE